ncbi:MAG: mechanosensitive ion channel, partial [Verrucomicrobia bacterium]|nr:mechanosensitive ion channel [Verrucomicrobiota bacterium]
MESNTQEIVAKLQEFAALYGVRVVAAIAILVIGRIVAGVVRGGIGKLMRRSKIDETLISFVANLVYFALMAFVIIAALGKLGVQTASFVAILGAAGLAIGLAL